MHEGIKQVNNIFFYDKQWNGICVSVLRNQFIKKNFNVVQKQECKYTRLTVFLGLQSCTEMNKIKLGKLFGSPHYQDKV